MVAGIFEDFEPHSKNFLATSLKMLETLKIDIAYNPVNNRNTDSGMMPARKNIIPKKSEACQQNLEAHQAPVMSFDDARNADKCSDIKVMLPSAEPTHML